MATTEQARTLCVSSYSLPSALCTSADKVPPLIVPVVWIVLEPALSKSTYENDLINTVESSKKKNVEFCYLLCNKSATEF